MTLSHNDKKRALEGFSMEEQAQEMNGRKTATLSSNEDNAPPQQHYQQHQGWGQQQQQYAAYGPPQPEYVHYYSYDGRSPHPSQYSPPQYSPHPYSPSPYHHPSPYHQYYSHHSPAATQNVKGPAPPSTGAKKTLLPLASPTPAASDIQQAPTVTPAVATPAPKTAHSPKQTTREKALLCENQRLRQEIQDMKKKENALALLQLQAMEKKVIESAAAKAKAEREAAAAKKAAAQAEKKAAIEVAVAKKAMEKKVKEIDKTVKESAFAKAKAELDLAAAQNSMEQMAQELERARGLAFANAKARLDLATGKKAMEKKIKEMEKSMKKSKRDLAAAKKAAADAEKKAAAEAAVQEAKASAAKRVQEEPTAKKAAEKEAVLGPRELAVEAQAIVRSTANARNKMAMQRCIDRREEREILERIEAEINAQEARERPRNPTGSSLVQKATSQAAAATTCSQQKEQLEGVRASARAHAGYTLPVVPTRTPPQVQATSSQQAQAIIRAAVEGKAGAADPNSPLWTQKQAKAFVDAFNKMGPTTGSSLVQNEITPLQTQAAAEAKADAVSASGASKNQSTANQKAKKTPPTVEVPIEMSVLPNNVNPEATTIRPTKKTVTATAIKTSSLGIYVNDHPSSGVAIGDIFPTSIFKNSALRKGMKILSVNGRDCQSTSQTVNFVRALPPGEITILAVDEPKPSGLTPSPTAANGTSPFLSTKNSSPQPKAKNNNNPSAATRPPLVAPATNGTSPFLPTTKNSSSKLKAKEDNKRKTPPLGSSNTAKKARRKWKQDKKQKNEQPNGVPLPADFPEPGSLCPAQRWYCCKNNDTVEGVADKLGIMDWKCIAQLPENRENYGVITGKAQFKVWTLLLIPKDKCSVWKLQGLQKESQKEKEFLEKDCCEDCGKHGDELLLCDGCDSHHHLQCVGLTSLPPTDWFCQECMQVLQARKNHVEQPLVAGLPPLPNDTLDVSKVYFYKLKQILENQRQQELDNLRDIHSAGKESWEAREAQLQRQVQEGEQQLAEVTEKACTAQREAMQRNGVQDWSLKDNRDDFIQLVDGIKLYKKDEQVNNSNAQYSQRWTKARQLISTICRGEPQLTRAKKQLETKLSNARKLLADETKEQQQFSASEKDDRHHVLMKYAPLLGEPQLPNETTTAFRRREASPRLLGQVELRDDSDITAMNFLREPEELIFTVPLSDSTDMEPKIGAYAVLARAALFDKNRDVKTPWKGVREAQRTLFNLLLQNSSNSGIMARQASVPSSVRLRTTPKASCFDLSELVKDCDVDLDLPKEVTPKVLAEHGLHLRDYQQSSLHWLLDKEREESQLGIAGEIFHRLRFLDDAAAKGDYYFCDLTNSFALTITNNESKDLAPDCFCLPSGGFLADEMGLGKTCISLALHCANPPPLHRRILPRELVCRGNLFDHPAYTPPPFVGKNLVLSNGTLIVVPMTLLSQWQSEIERFAPHLQVMVLHNTGIPSVQAVASHDIVLVSTSLIQRSSERNIRIVNALKRCYFHRILLDESHLQTQEILCSLSATFRHCISGTPIGASLSDLYHQLRFLRVAPFDRPSLWNNLMDHPYRNRDKYGLAGLRKLLSHVVVRHSKRQTSGSGNALLALPPRHMETVLLSFGTEEERAVYDILEARNRRCLQELKRESNATILAKYTELLGMMNCQRNACSHTTIVCLERIHRLNQELERRKNNGREHVLPPSVGNQTRNGLLELAVSRALYNSKVKMRNIISQYLFSSTSEEGEQLLECPVCLEVVGTKEIAVAPCAHTFCAPCVSNLLDAGTSTREASGKCPLCREKMKRSDITYLADVEEEGESEPAKEGDAKPGGSKPAARVVSSAATTTNGFVLESEVRMCAAEAEASSFRVSESPMHELEMDQTLYEARVCLHTLDAKFLRSYYTSERKIGTKMARLLKEIQEMIAKKQASKCAVFSLHTEVLDMAAKELAARGIRFVRIDASTTQQHQRADALLEFNRNMNTRVFLLSMRHGAVGLNLTAADHCFIFDIAQNSAIEEQAIDRIHRIGQQRPVIVKRFCMEGTIEQRILGVRRSLTVDQIDCTGTVLSGTRMMDIEESVRTQRGHVDDEEGKRQQRIAMLEELIGCSKERE